MNASEIAELRDLIQQGHLITKAEALVLAATTERQALYDAANELRRHFCGDRIDLCSITNARSGKCSENCKWCSQSAWHKSTVEIYPVVETDRAVREAETSATHGVRRHSLVTSGKRVTDAELDQFLTIFREIQARCSIGLCTSMGLLSREQLLRLKAAGIERYHCNLETAPSFFAQVCTTHSIEDKLETIRQAQAIGLEVCSGGIIGLGESMAQRIELGLLLRELGILSIPINILNPIPGTALEGAPPLDEDDVLTTIALFRFINPKAQLRFAGGRILIRHYQERALKAGINASIVGDMLTTLGSGVAEDLRDFTQAGFTVD